MNLAALKITETILSNKPQLQLKDDLSCNSLTLCQPSLQGNTSSFYVYSTFSGFHFVVTCKWIHFVSSLLCSEIGISVDSTKASWTMYVSQDMYWSSILALHNIIQIPNNVLWNWLYYTEYSTIQTEYEENFINIVLVLNNVESRSIITHHF